MRFQRSDGSTSGHQRNPSRLRTTRRAAIKQTTPRRLTRWLKLHEVGFTSALSQNLFVLEGRVALAVTRQGSHRSGRARIRASGSSTNSFTIHVVPEAIQSSDVDMLIEPRCVRHVSLD